MSIGCGYIHSVSYQQTVLTDQLINIIDFIFIVKLTAYKRKHLLSNYYFIIKNKGNSDGSRDGNQ